MSLTDGRPRKGDSGEVLAVGLQGGEPPRLLLSMSITILVIISEKDKWSALMGSLQISVSFDRGTFWVLPLTYFYPPQCARAYPFSQSVKALYFCSGPISVDPICPQPILIGRLPPRLQRAAAIVIVIIIIMIIIIMFIIISAILMSICAIISLLLLSLLFFFFLVLLLLFGCAARPIAAEAPTRSGYSASRK